MRPSAATGRRARGPDDDVVPIGEPDDDDFGDDEDGDDDEDLEDDDDTLLAR